MRAALALVLPLVAVALHAQTYDWDWAWGAGGAGNDHGLVYTSPAGEVHLLGTYAGSITSNGVTLTSSGGNDIFVQRLDPADGSVLWTAEAHHAGNLAIHAAAMRSTGELVVSGTIAHGGSTAQFGIFQVTGQPFGLQAFVAGISPTGQWTWVAAVNDPVSTEGWLVRVDANDNILLGCKWGADMAVYRFTGAGVQGWSATAASSGSSVDAYAMDVLPGGDLVLTGRFHGTTTFGGQSLTVGNAYYDVFVARLSAAGTWTWAIQGGGSHWDKGFGACATANGDVFVAGTFRNTATFGQHQVTAGGSNDVFVARVSGAGQWLWVEGQGISAYMEVYGMALDPLGDQFALTGTYGNAAAVIGGVTLPVPQFNDMYVAAFDTTGQAIAAMGFGSSSADQALSVGYGANHELYLAGYYGAAAPWGGISMPATQGYDLFVGRLTTDITTTTPPVRTPDRLRLYTTEHGLRVENPLAVRGPLLVLDATGRVIDQRPLTGAAVQDLSLPHLAPALYTWRVAASDGAVHGGRVVVP
ncbi:MAG: hypothetical protein IPM49_17790 [Flavobacteriales bacterium]|nr:hypothetical protein [Flavobacteriales bacterium]